MFKGLRKKFRKINFMICFAGTNQAVKQPFFTNSTKMEK